jgi:hypothetical protein
MLWKNGLDAGHVYFAGTPAANRALNLNGCFKRAIPSEFDNRLTLGRCAKNDHAGYNMREEFKSVGTVVPEIRCREGSNIRAGNLN